MAPEEPSEIGERADQTGGSAIPVLAPDVGGLSYWEHLTFCCLQGLANRDDPQVFFYYPEKSDEGWYGRHPVPDERVFYEWYDEYDDTDSVEFDDPYELFDRLDTLPFEGYVIVDRKAPVTANVAANYAGSENLLPVVPRMLDREELPDRPVEHDLRERHRGIRFREADRVETYEWAFNHQWPDSNHARLANLGTPETKPGLDISEYTDDGTVYLRFADAGPEDGGGTQLHELRVLRDGEVLTEIVPATDREQEVLVDAERASTGADRQIRWTSEDGYWIYELDGIEGADELELVVRNQWHVSISTAQDGPYDLLTESEAKDFGEPVTRFGQAPPVNDFYTSNRARDFTVAENGFFVDLASGGNERERDLKDRILAEMDDQGIVFGWHTGRGGDSEGNHIGHLSEHGQLAIGASTYAANMSFHSRFDPPGDAVARFRERAGEHRETPPLEDKIYLTFVLSDGDSLNFLLRRAQGGQWLLPERGDVPFGWEMPPLLADLGPGILDYFQATATENDHFVGGPSGVAYFYPGRMGEHGPDLDEVLASTKEAFARVGLTETTVMKPDGRSARKYREHVGGQLDGVMEGYVRGTTKPQTFDRGTDRELCWLPTALPLGHHARGSVSDLLKPLEGLADRWDDRPLFVPVHVTAHSLTIADVVELVEKLDDEFEVVGPNQFFTLAAEAGDAGVRDVRNALSL